MIEIFGPAVLDCMICIAIAFDEVEVQRVPNGFLELYGGLQS